MVHSTVRVVPLIWPGQLSVTVAERERERGYVGWLFHLRFSCDSDGIPDSYAAHVQMVHAKRDQQSPKVTNSHLK